MTSPSAAEKCAVVAVNGTDAAVNFNIDVEKLKPAKMTHFHSYNAL